MFYKSRLQPLVPEHDLFIEAELAKLKVLDKHDYENFKAIYDKKRKELLPNTVKVEEKVEIEEEVKAETVVEEKVKKVKKKPGRKKK